MLITPSGTGNGVGTGVVVGVGVGEAVGEGATEGVTGLEAPVASPPTVAVGAWVSVGVFSA
jgi:hypothetical protein